MPDCPVGVFITIVLPCVSTMQAGLGPGTPSLGLGSKLRLGVPNPRLWVLKPRLGVPKPWLGVPKPRLGDPKPRFVVPKTRLGVVAWLTVPIGLPG